MSETLDLRHARYRVCGWWPGERLPERYARVAAERPQALAVADDRGAWLSHEALRDRARALAAALADQGLQSRDVVLLFMPNRAEWQVAMLAVLELGAVPASLPVRTDPDTLRYVLELCAARVVITVEAHRGLATAERARAAAAGCPQAPRVVTLDGGEARDLEALGARPCPDLPASVDHLMFTSSTTGRPKAVMHTADTLAALNLTFTERFGLGPERAIFMPSPLGHSIGAIHGARLALFTGAPLVLQDRWDAGEALATVARHGCHFTAAATPFLKDLVDAPWSGPDPKLASLEWFLCGGAQVPPALMDRAAGEFPATCVTVLWGMTEGGLTTSVADSPREKVLATAGVALPGLELCVLDDEGEKRPTGEEGELSMRGPGVFVGYLGQPELYASCLTADGFFRTGDLARIDDDGYVRITGRLKDLIIRGGVNISPVPIEDALAAHPGVQAVAVVGYPDERLGERICAVIVPRGEAPEPAAIREFAASQGLAKALWPEVVRFVDDLPRTAAGKIRKNRVREALLEADGGVV